MRRTLNVILTVWMAVIASTFTSVASAQSPLAIDFEEAFTPDVALRDLPAFRSVLALDAEQVAIVESLIRDYNEQFTQALGAVRTDLRDAQAALGAEDPAVDAEREQLRQEMADMFEKLSQELENLPPGGSATEIRQKYEAQVKNLQERLEKLQGQPIKPEQLEKVFNDASLRLEQWRTAKKQLIDKFDGDAQTILRDQQRTLWPALDRQLRRERTLGRGLLQGESVDLTLVVLDLKPEQAQAAAGALADYQVALDAALRNRNDLIENSEREIFKAVQSGDRAALDSIVARITQARVAVREANESSAASIAAALGDAGSRFTVVFRQQAYPLVFRDTQTLRLLKAAQELNGLSPAQTESLTNLLAGYAAELDASNQQVLAAVRQFEPAQVTLREVHRLLPPTMDQENAERDRSVDGLQQAFAKRADMGKKYDNQLQSLLGADLYEKLPRNDRLVRPESASPGDGGDG